jgi:hypothetical protein
MFDTWNQFFLGRPIASQFVGDNDSEGKTRRFQQFAKELVRRSFITMTLHQNVDDLPVGIYGPPEVILLAFNRNYDFVQMPLVRRFGATATNLIRILLSKLFAPFTDHFVGHLNTLIEHHCLDVAVA